MNTNQYERDDIFVYAKTQEEHDNILNRVDSYPSIREKELNLNYEKCLFNKKKLTLFGHQFSEEGVKLYEKKSRRF